MSLTRAGQTHAWVARFADRLLLTDVAVVACAIAFAQFVRFVVFAENEPDLRAWGASFDPTWVSAVLASLWVGALSASGSRDARVLGSGSAEYKRVLQASLSVFGVVAIVAYVTRFDLARGYVAIALPLGLATLLIGRWFWRGWLSRKRRRGFFLNQAVVVGSRATALHVADELSRSPAAGFSVRGVCVPGGKVGEMLGLGGVPVLGDIDDAIASLRSVGAETLVLTSSDELPPRKIRELSWQLEPTRQHLIVAPALTDIGGPRLHTRPVAGLPLIHVETPRFEGSKRFLKRVFDIAVTLGMLAVLAVPMCGVALAVKIDSRGPTIFRQRRVGYRGNAFEMLKFRSMRTDAERVLQTLLDERDDGQDIGNAVLFKMKDDPRITRVGRFIRRYSLDELPQLLNVLRGDMSLVGPRPPLEREVLRYDEHVHRKFLVKPGITGLWQVSGRSNLSWEESVRLDLYYVENWSLAADLQILWRTVRAVVAREGAY
ncbi:sugar transferase [Agrococcus citreus]|uniref:Sugar transferase n=1 Tax=Agrococcus citreus TaxID=84643 RepID=A0ABN1YTL7_9MICO